MNEEAFVTSDKDFKFKDETYKTLGAIIVVYQPENNDEITAEGVVHSLSKIIKKANE